MTDIIARGMAGKNKKDLADFIEYILEILGATYPEIQDSELLLSLVGIEDNKLVLPEQSVEIEDNKLTIK